MKDNFTKLSGGGRSMKINSSFVMIFLAVGLIPLIVLGALNINHMKRTLEDGIHNDLMHLSEAKEGQIFAYLDGIESRTIDFASDGFIKEKVKEINENDSSAVSSLNNHLIKNKKILDDTLGGIIIMNPEGIIIASTDKEEIGRNESEDDYFIEGKKEPFFIELRTHKHFNLTNPFVVTAPLIDGESGEFLGVIANVFDAKKMQDILSGKFQLTKGAMTAEKYQTETLEIYLVNRNKEMFVHPQSLKHHTNFSHLAGMIVNTLPVQKCLEKNEEIVEIYNNYGGEKVIGVSECLRNQKWVLLVEIHTEEAFAPIKKMLSGSLLIVIIVFFLAILIALLFAKKISRPITHLSEQIDKITKGNLEIQLGKSKIYEQQKLIDSLNRILASLKLAVLRTGASKEELGLSKEYSENKDKKPFFKTKALKAVVDRAADSAKSAITKDSSEKLEVPSEEEIQKTLKRKKEKFKNKNSGKKKSSDKPEKSLKKEGEKRYFLKK